MFATVSTIPERCKRCYCCVRDCPAKAIQIRKGQAVVIAERCIACGNCVKVCTQNAKAVQNPSSAVASRLRDGGREERIALLAPSFAAAFPDAEPARVLGALRALGFTRIVEVAFGADLVSARYAEHVAAADGPIITTPCPAVVEYVEKYYPGLIPHLAPIVSPMIAAGRVARERYGAASYMVFIGPCIAKKIEIREPDVADVVDEALTFTELRILFREAGIDPAVAAEREYDQPRAQLGQIYPLSGGLLKSAGLSSDVMDEEVMVVEGRQRCINIIDEIARGRVRTRLIDVLFCEGCINGPGMDCDLTYFEKRARILRFTRAQLDRLNHAIWRNSMSRYAGLELTRRFASKSIREPHIGEEDILRVLAATGKARVEDQLNCGACGYPNCREHATAVALELAEPEMCLPYTIDFLERSHRELAEAQDQLVHTEKLASVGQLAAGVAHEINNPLGTILLYAHLLLRQLKDNGAASDDVNFIIQEAERCRNIVASLLNFARQGKLAVSDVRVADLLAGIPPMLERRPEFAAIRITVEADPDLTAVLDAEQLKQVLLNLSVNACEAMPEGGLLELRAAREGEELVVTVADTGTGIAKEHLSRLFTPFFTTKQIGKGTGLGLPIAYGIVKMHRGRIAVQSEPGQGSIFTVRLPLDVRALVGEPAPDPLLAGIS
jgi:two-component system, NtrC family, sensor kinase